MREREGEGDDVALLILWLLEASFNSSKRNWIRWERVEREREREREREGEKQKNSVVDLLKCCTTLYMYKTVTHKSHKA